MNSSGQTGKSAEALLLSPLPPCLQPLTGIGAPAAPFPAEANLTKQLRAQEPRPAQPLPHPGHTGYNSKLPELLRELYEVTDTVSCCPGQPLPCLLPHFSGAPHPLA